MPWSYVGRSLQVGAEADQPRDSIDSVPARAHPDGQIVADHCSGVAVIGLALWSSESGLQDQINSAPNNTTAQITALRDLEDRASTKAWEGNVLVFVGLAAAGIGTYYLLKDHDMHATVTPVGPVDHATGAAVLLGGRW